MDHLSQFTILIIYFIKKRICDKICVKTILIRKNQLLSIRTQTKNKKIYKLLFSVQKLQKVTNYCET